MKTFKNVIFLFLCIVNSGELYAQQQACPEQIQEAGTYLGCFFPNGSSPDLLFRQIPPEDCEARQRLCEAINEMQLQQERRGALREEPLPYNSFLERERER